VRRVLDVMRGRSFEDAILMMEYMPYRACEHILRTLKSVSAAVGAVCTSFRGAARGGVRWGRMNDAATP
jgi:hypothetical protein